MHSGVLGDLDRLAAVQQHINVRVAAGLPPLAPGGQDPGLHPAGPGLVPQQVQPHRLAHPATALRQQAPFLHRLVDRPASAAPRLVGSHTPIPLAQQTPIRPQNPFTLSSYRPPGDTAAQQPLQLGNLALQQQRSQPDILQATTLPVLLQVQRQQQPFQQQAGLGLAFSFGGQQNLGI